VYFWLFRSIFASYRLYFVKSQGADDMRTLTTLALTMTLTGGAFSVQAATQAEQDLAVCMTELHAHYGEDVELNLVDRRRNQSGTKMRVAAKLDADNSYFATCWVAKNDVLNADNKDRGSLLAVTYSDKKGD
jgi:hypothetical protein